MSIFALILFVIAAFGGIALLIYVLQGKNTPKALALAHGSIATLAILFLLIAAIYERNNFWIAFAFFVVVGLIGIFLFMADILGKEVLKVVAVLHGFAAFIGILLLAIIIFAAW